MSNRLHMNGGVWYNRNCPTKTDVRKRDAFFKAPSRW